MQVYELIPNDSHKSFYSKARITVNSDGSETLTSYTTPVMRKEIDGTYTRLWSGWSATTGRHIKAFSGMSKAEYMALPHEMTPAEKAQAYNGTLYR